VGQRSSRTETLPGFGASPETYSYDASGQLVGVAYGVPPSVGGGISTVAYSFNAVGNRTLSTLNGTATAYQANNINQYISVGAENLNYNTRGDQLTYGEWALQWAADGHLVVASKGGAIPSEIRYVYDGLGNRVGQSRGSVAGGFATEWMLHLGAQVLEAWNTSTESSREYVYEPGIDQPLCAVDGGGALAHYFHQDGLGSVVVLTDATGAVVESYRYTAWGQPTVVNAVGVPQAEGTAAASAYLFTGREFEAETGLAFHRARYYAPGMGRWLGPDPIGEMGGLNLYGYVGNRVTGAKDPLGLIILLRISFPFSEKLMRRSIPDISRTIIRGSGAVF